MAQITFSPNTQIKSADANANFTELFNPTLGYAEFNSSQGDFSGGADITNLSTTAIVPAGGRRVKMTAQLHIGTNIADTLAKITIQEGTTVLGEGWFNMGTATQVECIQLEYIGVPTAGSHTYKVRGERQGGTGTLTISSTATRLSFIHIELA